MNRIVIDEVYNSKSNDNNLLEIDINNTGNYTLNNTYKSYVINIHDSNVNLFTIVENKNIDITINIFNSIVTLNTVNYNGKKQNIVSNLNTSNSSFKLYNSVIVNDYLEANILIYHNDSSTYSDVYNFGVTKNNGSILFNVISKVPRGYKKCIVNQDSKIVSLNKTNENAIKPILLVDEFDTEAKHAAFIGKFDDEKVFYMQTRGLSKKESYNLLLNGYLIGMLEVSDEEKDMLKEKYEKNWR